MSGQASFVLLLTSLVWAVSCRCDDEGRSSQTSPSSRVPAVSAPAAKQSEGQLEPPKPPAPPKDEVDGLSSASMTSGGPWKPSGPLPPTEPGTTLDDARAPVYVERGLDPRRVARRLLEQLDPELDPETPVLLTPNVGGITWFSNDADDRLRGRITDPEFVRGVIEFLRDRGVRRITLGVSWATGRPTAMAEMLRRSGYRELADAFPEVTLVDLFHGGEETSSPAHPVVVATPEARQLEGRLTLPAVYVQHQKRGLIINLPKLKTHRFAVLTAGMKNLMGVLGVEEDEPTKFSKWKMHRELGPLLKRTKGKKQWSDEELEAYQVAQQRFARRLADVYQVARPHLTLIDGVLASDGDGFDSLSSVPLGLGIGSKNAAYADVIAAQAAGLWGNEELYQKAGVVGPLGVVEAMERFYGGAKSSIAVVGSLPDQGGLDVELMNQRNVRGRARQRLSDGPWTIPQVKELPTLTELAEHWPLEGSTFLTRNFAGERLPPTITTALVARRTSTHVLFAARAQVLGLDLRPHPGEPETEQDVAKLYSWDNFEIFLDPTPETPQEYYEIEVSPEGERLDLHVKNGPGRVDLGWDSRADIATRIDERPQARVWLVRIVVPLEVLGERTPGPWAANFYRTERYGQDRIYSAWQPVGGTSPNFHQPEKFGRLLVEGDPASP